MKRFVNAVMAHRKPTAWLSAGESAWQVNPAWQALVSGSPQAGNAPSPEVWLRGHLAAGRRRLAHGHRFCLICAPARLERSAPLPLRWQLHFQTVIRRGTAIGYACRLQLRHGWLGLPGQRTILPWFLPAGAVARVVEADGVPLLASLTERVHPDDCSELSAALAGACSTGDRFVVDCRLRVPRGAYHLHRLVGRPEHDSRGRLIGWLGGSQDRQQLADTCRMRRAFLKLASHELNTPLTGLTLNLQLALSRLDRARHCQNAGEDHRLPSLEGLLGRALSQAERLRTTVEGLLDVQCLMAGKLPLERGRFDVAELLHQCVDALEPALLQANCRVTLEAPRGLVAEVDGPRIQQVYFHLISNVAKFAPGSHVLLRAFAGPEGIGVEVHDDGPGISASARADIFKLFGRGKTERASSGLGIGLYYCRRILRAHGGSLRLLAKEATGAKGAHFLLTLPPEALTEAREPQANQEVDCGALARTPPRSANTTAKRSPP